MHQRAFQIDQRDVALTAFNSSNVSSVEPANIRKLLL
jgi:hypothetical protein